MFYRRTSVLFSFIPVKGLINMATYHDPIQCFAPLEVIERLLELRADFGFPPMLFLENQGELADFLDAYGFDIYAFSTNGKKINYGDYRAPIVPGGDNLHSSPTVH
jgi:hypothetical protein